MRRLFANRDVSCYSLFWDIVGPQDRDTCLIKHDETRLDSVIFGVTWCRVTLFEQFLAFFASFGSAGSPFSCFLKLAWQLARNTVQTEPRPNM